MPPTTGIIHAPWLGFKHDREPPVPTQKESPIDVFSDYFRQRGHDLDFTKTAPSTRERAAQYQSWLTFGVLEAILERPVLESELLELEGGKHIMSSKNIPGIMQSWARGIEKIREDEPSGEEERFKAVLMWARKEIKTLLVNDSTNVFLYPGTESGEPESESGKLEKRTVMMAIVAMIAVIGEGLEIIRSQYRVGKLVDGVKPFKLGSVLDTCVAYKEVMLAKGWCPFTLRKLGSVTAAIYASLYEPVPSFKGHNGCDSLTCNANLLPKGDARLPSHYPKDCKCEYLGPPAAGEVIAILKQRKIPVVTLGPPNDPPGDRVKVSLASDTKYVAISHVWSDGLRDTKGAALPKCQLERIDKMTRKLVPDGSGAFWLDTLCIHEGEREIGLRLMGETYKGAAKVLVIDDGIRRCSKDAPLEEKLLRILTSVWMGRLWTLQEAVYAGEMFFEFSDGLVSVVDLLPKKMDSIQGHLAVDLYQLVQRMPNFTGTRNYSNIWDISRALATRSAGRSEDETLAVVDLIHDSSTDSFELAKITLPQPEAKFKSGLIIPESEIPPGTDGSKARDLKAAFEAKERMKAFLTSCSKLPPNILYLKGPKLEDPCFRWAPRSFMTAQGVLPNKPDDYCVATGNGVIGVEYGGFMSLSFEEITLKPGQRRYIETLKTNKDKKPPRPYFFEISGVGPGSEYCCNVIMMWLPEPGLMGTFAAGLVKDGGQKTYDSGDTQHDCEYKGLLQLHVLKERPKDQVLIQSKYGRRNLRIL